MCSATLVISTAEKTLIDHTHTSTQGQMRRDLFTFSAFFFYMKLTDLPLQPAFVRLLCRKIKVAIAKGLHGLYLNLPWDLLWSSLKFLMISLRLSLCTNTTCEKRKPLLEKNKEAQMRKTEVAEREMFIFLEMKQLWKRLLFLFNMYV